MMSVVLNVGIVVVVFFLMEGAAWVTHKYVMHGFLWSWHRSHHTVHKHTLERNDLFAVVFSIPAIVLIVVGDLYAEVWYLFYIGLGISAYGLFYFIFHDVIVHRRLKTNYKARSGYMRRIMRAHYVHHEKHTKQGCEAFGFLYAPKKYAEEQR